VSSGVGYFNPSSARCWRQSAGRPALALPVFPHWPSSRLRTHVRCHLVPRRAHPSPFPSATWGGGKSALAGQANKVPAGHPLVARLRLGV